MVIAVAIVVLIVFGTFYLQSRPYEPPQYMAEYPLINILPDGTIEPSSAPINFDGNSYTLQRNIEVAQLSIEKSNTIFDGNGFSFKSIIERYYKAGADYRALYLNVSNVEKVTLRNIECTGPGLNLIFENSSSCQVTNSNVSISINNSNNIIISNMKKCYVTLANSTNCTVSSCKLPSATLKNSHQNMILNNDMTATKVLALGLEDSNSNLFFGNRIERTHKLFEITGHSNNNLFVGNYIKGEFSFDPILDCSGINTFYHNNFIYVNWDKTLASTANKWDNGFEGNYWNDYQGADSNHDGIGDTPYLIDANNQDENPLMEQLALSLEPQPQLPK